MNNPNGYILLNMPILKAAFDDAAQVLDERLRERAATSASRGSPGRGCARRSRACSTRCSRGGRRIKHIVKDLKDFARREDEPRARAGST